MDLHRPRHVPMFWFCVSVHSGLRGPLLVGHGVWPSFLDCCCQSPRVGADAIELLHHCLGMAQQVWIADSLRQAHTVDSLHLAKHARLPILVAFQVLRFPPSRRVRALLWVGNQADVTDVSMRAAGILALAQLVACADVSTPVGHVLQVELIQFGVPSRRLRGHMGQQVLSGILEERIDAGCDVFRGLHLQVLPPLDSVERCLALGVHGGESLKECMRAGIGHCLRNALGHLAPPEHVV